MAAVPIFCEDRSYTDDRYKRAVHKNVRCDILNEAIGNAVVSQQLAPIIQPLSQSLVLKAEHDLRHTKHLGVNAFGLVHTVRRNDHAVSRLGEKHMAVDGKLRHTFHNIEQLIKIVQMRQKMPRKRIFISRRPLQLDIVKHQRILSKK